MGAVAAEFCCSFCSKYCKEPQVSDNCTDVSVVATIATYQPCRVSLFLFVVVFKAGCLLWVWMF